MWLPACFPKLTFLVFVHECSLKILQVNSLSSHFAAFLHLRQHFFQHLSLHKIKPVTLPSTHTHNYRSGAAGVYHFEEKKSDNIDILITKESQFVVFFLEWNKQKVLC